MTPIELSNLYQALRARLATHLPGGCAEISLMLPTSFGDELAFYRLVNWGYALVNEAARVPLAFLINLPPLKTDYSFRREIMRLRTYIAHNLDTGNSRDQKTYAFVHRWFKETCGRGTPDNDAHYSDCCAYLTGRFQEVLNGAIAACDLLDDPEDGPRLVADLKGRIDLAWEAHRFDPMVAECAVRLGNPGLDLQAIRSKHLDKWRDALSKADPDERERVLEQQIEADLLAAIGDALPRTIRENLQQVGMNAETTAAALLLLHESRRISAMTLPQILEFVSLQVLTQGRLARLEKADHLDGDGNVGDTPGLIGRTNNVATGWACPGGALALAGAWGELDDRDADALVEEIYAARRRDTGRPVELED